MKGDLVYRIRISDNVLDEEDWPIREILIRDGVIVNVLDVHHGVYSWGETTPTIGWDLERLCEWLDFDPTGSHPENWHEILFHGKWECSVKAENLLNPRRL